MDYSQPSLLSAAWKHRLVFAGIVALTLTIALFMIAMGAETRTSVAQALVVVRDPSALEGGGTSDRFISEQAQLLRSPIVAGVAAEKLSEGAPDFSATPAQLQAATIVSSFQGSSLVFISISDPDAARAVAWVNAVAEGYQEVSRLQATQNGAAALDRIDAQLESLQTRFTEVGGAIQAERDADESLRQLEAQFQEALAQLPALQAELAVSVGDTAAALRQRISDYRTQIDTYRQAVTTAGNSPQLQALLQEQEQSIIRRTDLLQRRDQLAIDIELAPGAVALLDPAEEATELVETGASRMLAVALVLGVMGAFATTYVLELRRRTFSRRSEPAVILGAPLLADIPLFSEENLQSDLPVRDEPRSAVAESFRFAASSIEDAMRSRGAKSVMMVGATLGHGKSTCIVNTAMASALQGNSILLIDADFGNQNATRLVLNQQAPAVGLIDVAEVGASFDDAVTQVPLGRSVSFSLMSRGTRPTVAANILLSGEAESVFQEAAETFDLVFADAPPLLQVAYASTLANHVDALVVVVSHGSPVREVEELADRLQLINTPVLGYLYNKSPLRREMRSGDGSLVDILGEEGLSHTTPTSRRPWWQKIGTQ